MLQPLYARYLDETHAALREQARRFAASQIAPHAEAWEEACEFPRDLYLRAAEAGVLAPTFPEEHGGGGGDVFHGIGYRSKDSAVISADSLSMNPANTPCPQNREIDCPLIRHAELQNVN